MEWLNFWSDIAFSVNQWIFTWGQLIIAALYLLLILFLTWFALRWLPLFYERKDFQSEWKNRINFTVYATLFTIGLIGVLKILAIDLLIYQNPETEFRIMLWHLLLIGLLYQIAVMLDWVISRVSLYNIYSQKVKPTHQTHGIPPESLRNKAPRHAVKGTLVSILLLNFLEGMQMDYQLLDFPIGKELWVLSVSNIIAVFLIIFIAKIIAWVLTQLVLFSYYRRKEIDLGTQYAVNQLLTYVIFVIAIFAVIQSLGFKFAVLWGGAAALLVGVGLGLQQTFNDLISGIILLFERTVEVGDVIELPLTVGTVKKIGLRTSLIETRDNIILIIPNSKIIVDQVTNWSHFDDKARFRVGVGVSYKSDIHLVKETLNKVANEHAFVMDFPAPIIRFSEFGDSSLNFELLFWSRNLITIEDVKSDLRFKIYEAFQENAIQVPFPQRDLHLKSLPPDEIHSLYRSAPDESRRG